MKINDRLYICDDEIELKAIRAQGAGGQKVNKTSSAIHLSFNILESSLTTYYKQRLLAFRDSRISPEGIITIKAQEHRTQKDNKRAAFERLAELINKATIKKKKRIPTKASYSSKQKRLNQKTKHGQKKDLRKKPHTDQ